MCVSVCASQENPAVHITNLQLTYHKAKGLPSTINERNVTEIHNCRGAQQPLVYIAAVAAVTVALQPGHARLVPQRVTCHMYA